MSVKTTYLIKIFFSLLLLSCTNQKRSSNIKEKGLDHNQSENISKAEITKIGELLEDGTYKVLLDTIKLKRSWSKILADTIVEKISKISIKERLVEDRTDTTFYYLSAESRGKHFTMGKLLFKKGNEFYFYNNQVNKGYNEETEIAFEAVITCYSLCEYICQPSLFRINKTYYWSCQGCEFDCIKSTSIGM
ncbi:MAG: hypothetical protein CL613_06825 [Aquimarina sp.]|nr:hypothetical protein [Aquimarina sp.]